MIDSPPPLPQQKNVPNRKGRRLIVIAVAVLTCAAILVVGLGHARELARRADCGNDVKGVGVVCALFARESEGNYYPELSSEPGRLMFALSESSGSMSVYPDFLADLGILLCPSDSNPHLKREPGIALEPEDLVDDHSHFYLGYAVINDDEVAAFAEAYRARIDTGEAFLGDLKVPATDKLPHGKTIHRLREGVERFFITDINGPGVELPRLRAALPVMIERPENHPPGGGHVLFLDGHVEFIPYPGEWPMTEKTIGILRSLDAL